MSDPPAKKAKTEETLDLINRPVQVTDLIFGASGIGCLYTDVPEEQAVETVEKALTLGFRHLDTAPWYGAGLSETRLGKILKNQKICKNEELSLYSKVGRVIRNKDDVSKDDKNVEWDCWDGFQSEPYNHAVPVYKATTEGVIEAHNQILDRMQVSGISCLRLHDAENEARFQQATEEGGMDALIKLKKDGKVKQISLGMNDADWILKYVKKYPNTFDNLMVAGCWNLLDQSGYDLFLECARQGIKIHIAGIFGSGILWGSNHYKYADVPNEIREKATKWGDLCKKFDLSLPAVALAFGFLPKVVEFVAVGMKKPSQVESNVSLCGTKVPAELWAEAKEQGLLDPRIVVA